MKYNYIINNEKFDTIVLIHGWNLNKTYMEIFIPSLSNQFNILIIDLFSSLNEIMTIDKYILELNDIIISCNIKNKLVIMGHSFGGKLAYFYAKRYKCDYLILLAPSLFRRHFSLIRWIKIKIFKLFKKCKLKLPKSLLGSKDYQNAKGNMKKTFLNCVNVYAKNKIDTKSLVFGFKNDTEIKKYQIKGLKKYLKNLKIIFYPGNHFAYIDYVKEIRLEIDKFVS